METRRALAHHMAPVARNWRSLADSTLAELGVSNSAGWCLIHIDRMEGDVRQATLAESLDISQPSLVRTLDQLQSAGLLTREPDPDDKRSNHIVLTADGRDLTQRIEAKLGALRDELLDGVPDEAVEIAVNLMQLLGARIADRRSAP